jgi:parallel beta-helix repeat protein
MTQGGNLWAALQGVRGQNNPVIDIEPGTYSADQWANIGSWATSYSGTLTIQGKNGGNVIVDGGFKITGWTQDSTNPKILKTTISKNLRVSGEDAVSTWRFESFWVNDHDTTRARVPSTWTLPTITSVSTSGYGSFITYTVGVPSATMRFLSGLSTSELQDVNIVLFHYWATTRAYIKSIDTGRSTITFTAHSVGNNNKGIEAGKTYFYLDNFKRALTKPGEWFLDRDGTLYYYPKDGETASNIQAYASHRHRIMYVQMNNVVFKNIEFRHCGGNMPSTGITREDYIPSGKQRVIDVYLSSNVQFINCKVRHCYCRAISIYDCQNCVVSGCLIEDFGADGIAFGACSGSRIYNNILRHGGRVIHHENAIYDNRDPGAVISHNDISDMIWDGINVWAQDSQVSMIIEKNHVHHIGFNIMDDIGCIYVTNAQKGVVIRNNHVHHAGCHNYGGWGIYVDLNCHNVVVESNLAHDFYDGCIHFHYGNYNEVRNNILAFGKIGLISKGTNDNRQQVYLDHNIFITNSGYYFCDYWGYNSFDAGNNNIFYAFDKPNFQWLQNNDGKMGLGQSFNPNFKDPLNRDFTFTDDSKVRALGFQPFTYSDCGVVGDEWRRVASSYQIEAFPEKSTNDNALFNNEPMYGSTNSYLSNDSQAGLIEPVTSFENGLEDGLAEPVTPFQNAPEGQLAEPVTLTNDSNYRPNHSHTRIRVKRYVVTKA